MKKHPILQKIQTALFFITWAFIAWFLYKNAPQVTQFMQVRNIYYLVGALLVLFVTFYFQLEARIGIARAFGLKIKGKEHFHILAHNNILKYLPGGIWNQLDAALMLKKNGNSNVKTTGKLVFVEIFWRVVWGYVFFGWIVQESFRYELGPFRYTGELWHYFAIVALLFLSTLLLAQRHPGIYLYSVKSFIQQMAANFFFWIFSALEFVLMILAFTTLSFTPEQLLYMGAANVVAWVVGFLVIPAPSGLGVREYVLGMLFAIIPGSGGIVAGVSLALLQRIMVLARDLLVYLYAVSVRSHR
jgi:hypothetical protein